MHLRPIALGLLSGLCLPMSPMAIMTGVVNRTYFIQVPSDLMPPRIDAARAATLTEQEIIDCLSTPETTERELVNLLEALGRFDRSHRAVATLINWLNFEDWGKRFGKKTIIFMRETIPLYCPAEESLKRIGAFAVPQLVDAYIRGFENPSATEGHGFPGYRPLAIAVILIASPEVAACSVECSWDYMASNPEDDSVQRACRDLCLSLHQFHWEDRVKLFKSFSRNEDGSILTPDRAALAELLDDFPEDDERAEPIAKLAAFKKSPIVISELVHWLEFQPHGLYSKGKHDPNPRRLEDCPAALALVQFGPAAASQLVGDYLYYFENTDIDNNRKRMYVWEAKDDTSKPYEVQDPTPRLALIAAVLSRKPETAQKAVGYAFKRMDAQPGDARVQRAGSDLIVRIVKQFPKSERAELFPGISLP